MILKNKGIKKTLLFEFCEMDRIINHFQLVLPPKPPSQQNNHFQLVIPTYPPSQQQNQFQLVQPP